MFHENLVEFLAPFRYVIWFIFILAVTAVVAKIFRALLNRHVIKSSKILKVDPTQYNFLRHSMTAVIYLVGIGVAVYTIPGFRTLAVSMLAGAGILAIVIGFASQEALSNIISGIMIVIFKPFRVGDWISIGTTMMMGTVEDITLRHTVIKTRENRRIVIPNSVMGRETIENSHLVDEKTCNMIEFSISYDSDIDLATSIMQDEVMKHPDFLDNRSEEQKKEGAAPVRVAVIGFGDSSIRLRAWAWAETSAKAYFMGLDLNKKIKERFDKEGVEIPFPYRTLVYKKDLKPPRKTRKRLKTARKAAKKATKKTAKKASKKSAKRAARKKAAKKTARKATRKKAAKRR